MSFTLPSRGQTVLHTHITQFGNYFTGTNVQEVLRAGNSALTYADSLTQIDATVGRIFRAGYGALGSQTWMLDVTKTGVSITNPTMTGNLAITGNLSITGDLSIGGNWYDNGQYQHDLRYYGLNAATAAITACTATPTVTAGAVASIAVPAVDTSGNVRQYAWTPAVTITGAGTGATATAVMSTMTVTHIAVYDGGAGYSSTPTVSITGGGGSSATATAVMNGAGTAVASITVTDAGSGFTSAPTVSFSGGSPSRAAIAVAELSGRHIDSITVDAGGSGYVQATTTVTIGGVWYDTAANVRENTAAFHAALAAAGDGIIYCPPGVYLTNQIDGTSASGNSATIKGAGRLVPGVSVQGDVWFDFTGRGGVKIYDIGMGDTANPSIPSVGCLYGNDNTGNASNVHYGDGWRMAGFYSVADLYGFVFNSSRFLNCGWSNGYQTGGASCVYLSAQNKASITSRFCTVSSTYAGCTDVTFFGCEFHGDNYLSSSNYALRLENAAGIRLFGATVSAGGTAVIRLDTDIVGATPGYCGLTIKGGNLYPETGNIPDYAIDITNPDTSGYIRELTIEDCLTAVETAVVRAAASTEIKKFRLAAWQDGNTATSVIVPASGSLTLADPDLICNNLAVNLGGSGVIQRGKLIYPGIVTANTNTAEIVQSDGSHIYRAGYIGLGATPASAGALRMPAGESARFRNGTNTFDLILGSVNSGNDFQMAVSTGGTLGSVTIGQTSNSSTVAINSTSGVSLTYGATTRIATKSTGVDVTGVLDATGAISGTTVTGTTALIAGSSVPASGAIRIPLNTDVNFRNGSGNAARLIGSDASGNVSVGQIGAGIGDMYVMTPGQMNFYGGGSVRFQANGTGVGFNGATPVAPPAYTVTNPTTNRSIDVTTITLANLAQVVGTMIRDLKPAATGGNGLFA